MNSKLRYVPQLDGLRAIACAVVVFHHIPTPFGTGGYIGVDVFFVLSGFLITGLLRSEMVNTGAVQLRSFYARRLRRLTPALVLCVLFVVQLYLLVPIAPNKHDTAIGGLLTLTYTGAWAKAFGWSSLGWLAHTWSLSVEEHFYLLWPLVVRFARTNLNRLIAISAALLGASSLVSFVGYARGWSTDRLVFAPDTRAKDLLVGCVLALALERGLLSKRPPVALGGVSLGVLVLWSIAVPKESALYLLGWPIVLAAAACAVWVLVSHDASSLSRALAKPGLVWVGKRSYGIYLWHYPLTIINAAVVGWTAPSRVLVAVGTTTTATLLAAWSYRFVEQPLRDEAYGPLTVEPLCGYLHHIARRRRSIRTSSAGNTSGSKTPSWSRRTTYPSTVAFSTTKPLAQRPSNR